ncbi:MAG: hypothetical protein HKO65_19085 [Gemmatimonadetes bacterium]|nr:zf-HC2 domain-containing protein [Gemmatimonadota bacterium]NNM07205.1 hypothetical protein [Gemmatimonadota bacterium]
MRHVTDGELHAFLDGALDLLAEGRGDEVRDHLADCPTCSERLQDEEGVRARAMEILGAPSISGVGLPTFEELRERAEAPGPDAPMEREEPEGRAHYRGPLRGLPMAWAATIVLALGVGWMGGQVWRGIPGDGRPTRALDRLETAPSQEGTSQGPEADSLPGFSPDSVSMEALVVTSSRRRDGPMDSPPQPAQADQSPATEYPSGAQEPARVGENVQEGERQVRATPAEERTDPRPPSVVGSEDIPLEALTGRGKPVADSAAPAADPSLFSQVLALRELREEEALEPTSEVRDSVETHLAVPGLKVVSVEWEERVPGQRALLIRQLLSPGDTLELHYLGLLMGTDAEFRYSRAVDPVEEMPGRRAYASVLEASLPTGWNQVVMERERGLLVARAHTDENHLKALLRTLR